ncbi:MAG TPA: PRD domain-containing protein [Firmicutes bacterium]|nr:PRD domain-containing protein [Candidatus Fermentithermobacillaceae bacterium]
MIAGSNAPVTASEIARELGVTVRTVRSDLGKVRDWIRDTATDVVLESKPGVGLWLSGPDEAIQKLLQALSRLLSSCPDDVVSREHLILYRLLTDPHPLSIKELSAELAVSRNTVRQSLRRCGSKLRTFGVELKSAGRGLVKVEGSETSIRRALAALVENPESGLGAMYFKVIRKAIEEVDSTGSYGLLDGTKTAIAMHLWASIQKMRNSPGTEILPGTLPEPSDPEVLDRAGKIVASVGSVVGLSLPEHEKLYVAIYLEADKVRQESLARVAEGDESFSAHNKQLLERAHDAAKEIIERVSAETGIHVEEDHGLLLSLKFHLAWTLSASEAGVIINNPFKKEIMKKYPGLFNVAKRACESCPALSGLISDDEVAYVAMHIGASMQRLIAPRKTRALVVCTTGLGTARFLSARLESMCPEVQLDGVTSLSELEREIEAKRPQLIISTVGFPPGKEPGIPWVHVSPLLGEGDLKRIKDACAKVKRSPVPADPLESLERPALGCNARKDASSAFEAKGTSLSNVPGLSPGSQMSQPPGIPADLIPLTDDEIQVEIIRACTEFSREAGLTADEQTGLIIHALLACPRWRNGEFAPPEPECDYDAALMAVLKKCFEQVEALLRTDLPPQEYICMLRYKGSDW